MQPLKQFLSISVLLCQYESFNLSLNFQGTDANLPWCQGGPYSKGQPKGLVYICQWNSLQGWPTFPEVWNKVTFLQGCANKISEMYTLAAH